MKLETLRAYGVTLRARPPLSISTEPDECGKYAYMEEPLDVCAIANSPDELVQEVQEWIVHDWQTYALSDPATLSLAAQALGSILRARFSEVQA